MKKKLIQSVLRSNQILDIVSNNQDGICLKDIAKKLELGSSTVFYLIHTLIYNNFIIQSNNKYKLGPKNLQLGNSYLESLSIYKIATPILEDLLKKINETIYLYIIEHKEFLELAKLEGTHAVKPTRIATNSNNAHATAVGKILLSSFSKDELKEFTKTGMKKFTKNTISSFKQLSKEMDKIKENQYALDFEESEIGIFCISVPIHNHKKEIYASIGVSIPAQRFSKARINKYLSFLKNGAAAISNALGFQRQ